MKIVQLDLEHNLVNVFESISNASQTVGFMSVSSLNYAIRHTDRAIKGFYWMYKKDYDLLHAADQSAH